MRLSWCPREDLNLHAFTAHPPQGCLSTNFNTRACPDSIQKNPTMSSSHAYSADASVVSAVSTVSMISSATSSIMSSG